MNNLIKKINNSQIIKVSLIFIIVSLVMLIGIKFGESIGKFLYYMKHWVYNGGFIWEIYKNFL